MEIYIKFGISTFAVADLIHKIADKTPKVNDIT
jgi:hypothetical protein